MLDKQPATVSLRCQSNSGTYHCDGAINHPGPHYYLLGANIQKTWRESDPTNDPSSNSAVSGNAVSNSVGVDKTGTALKDNLIINGVASTKMPGYNLIYKSALLSLAARFELGEERKKDKAINALHLERTAIALQNADFVLARMNNAINHIFNAIGKLSGGLDDGEDDAGAIMFAGAILAEYYARHPRK